MYLGQGKCNQCGVFLAVKQIILRNKYIQEKQKKIYKFTARDTFIGD